MTIQQLQVQENKLLDRKNRLHVSINEQKQNLNDSNIEAKAQVINSLEIQLDLTETALQNTQNKLTEENKRLASKEYQNKLETYQKLYRQATEQTVKVYKKLVELEKEAGKADNLVEQTTKAYRQFETDKVKLAYSSPSHKQPFSWLKALRAQLNMRLKQAEYIKDKLEV